MLFNAFRSTEEAPLGVGALGPAQADGGMEYRNRLRAVREIWVWAGEFEVVMGGRMRPFGDGGVVVGGWEDATLWSLWRLWRRWRMWVRSTTISALWQWRRNTPFPTPYPKIATERQLANDQANELRASLSRARVGGGDCG